MRFPFGLPSQESRRQARKSPLFSRNAVAEWCRWGLGAFRRPPCVRVVGKYRSVCAPDHYDPVLVLCGGTDAFLLRVRGPLVGAAVFPPGLAMDLSLAMEREVQNGGG